MDLVLAVGGRQRDWLIKCIADWRKGTGCGCMDLFPPGELYLPGHCRWASFLRFLPRAVENGAASCVITNKGKMDLSGALTA